MTNGDSSDTLGEFGLIKRIGEVLAGQTSPHAKVHEGLGDDCAVVEVGDRTLLLTTDMALEGRHFRLSHTTPEAIGYKVALAAISDIAAMGGQPLFLLTSLALTKDTPPDTITALYQGLRRGAEAAGAVLVGGDTTRSEQGLIIDVTVVGEASDGVFITRKGAQPGDVLAVTGRIGLAAAGLHALEHGHEDGASLRHRHYDPPLRIAEGKWFARHPLVRAMIDLSDGLAGDAAHLADAAGLGVDLIREQLFLAPSLTLYCEKQRLDAAHFALHGGEDYELAIVLDGKQAAHIVEDFNAYFRTELTVVGRFTDAFHGARVDGEEVDLGGFDHFRTQK